jgi:hypothetical protein
MSQLFDLIQKQKGKETVMMTDSLPKVNNRIRTLRTSHKGKNIEYVVRQSTSEKYRRPAAPGGYQSGSYGISPRKIP